MERILKQLMADQSGATAIEYGLICAIISLALVAAMNSLSPELNGTFAEVKTGLASR